LFLHLSSSKPRMSLRLLLPPEAWPSIPFFSGKYTGIREDTPSNGLVPQPGTFTSPRWYRLCFLSNFSVRLHSPLKLVKIFVNASSLRTYRRLLTMRHP
jgi:hypothetical protein